MRREDRQGLGERGHGFFVRWDYNEVGESAGGVRGLESGRMSVFGVFKVIIPPISLCMSANKVKASTGRAIGRKSMSVVGIFAKRGKMFWDEGRGDGPDHPVSRSKLTAYENDVKRKKDGGNVVLALGRAIEGEEEHHDMGDPRKALKNCLEGRSSPPLGFFVCRGRLG